MDWIAERCAGLCRIVLLGAVAAAGGCAAYAVPGQGASFQKMGMTPAQRDARTDSVISAALEKKPLAGFPATVAVVRIEATGYQPRTVELYGDGAYRVVVTHDVEKPEQFKKLAELPMMAGFEPLNRLELPEQLNSNLDLRQAAARVHADMLLIYTFNTDFDDRDLAEALTLLTIGISPNKSLTVTSTASAVLIDTRNGYIYGACEATEKKTTLANCWGENAAAESLRDQVETAAFEKMVSDFQTIAWPNVVRQYATPAATRPGA